MKNTNAIIFTLIVVLSLFLRFYGLETLPKWDWDEGENMNLSWNLLHGRLQLYALTYPFIPHPPLFYIAGAAFMKLFGNTLLSLRILTSLYGVLTTIIIYYIGRELLSERIGLLASLLYTIYPAAVYFNRIAFANNQLMLLYMLTVYATIRFLKTKKDRFLYAASFFAGLGVITEFGGAVALMSLLIVIYMHSGNKITDLIKSAAVSTAPSALTYIFIIKSFGLETVKYELTHGTGRIGVDALAYILLLSGAFLFLYRRYIIKVFETNVRSIKEDLPVYYLLLSLVVFIPLSDNGFYAGEDYFWFGTLGLFLIQGKTEKQIMLAFFLPLVLVIFFAIGRPDHMLIPLYPYFALGLSVLLIKIFDLSVPYVERLLARVKPNPSHRQTITATLILLSYPFTVILCSDFSAFVLGRGLAHEQIQDNKAVIEYINAHVSENDVVLASSHMGTLVKAKASVLSQGLAIEDKGVAYYYGKNIPKERFTFNCSYRNAKYIVVDDNDLKLLTKHQPNIADEIRAWKIAFNTQNHVVYENPG